jgi:hypothetical protein
MPSLVCILAYAAASVAATRENLTLYRVTPQNVTGIAEKDTADAAGDLYFQLYQLTFPLYCQQNQQDASCHTTIFDDINQDVYRQVRLSLSINTAC